MGNAEYMGEEEEEEEGGCFFQEGQHVEVEVLEEGVGTGERVACQVTTVILPGQRYHVVCHEEQWSSKDDGVRGVSTAHMHLSSWFRGAICWIEPLSWLRGATFPWHLSAGGLMLIAY